MFRAEGGPRDDDRAIGAQVQTLRGYRGPQLAIRAVADLNTGTSTVRVDVAGVHRGEEFSAEHEVRLLYRDTAGDFLPRQAVGGARWIMWLPDLPHDVALEED